MPHEKIQDERVEKARFRIDEAVIRGRGNGQLRVGEQVEQFDGLFGRNPVAIAGEEEHRVGYRGQIFGSVVQRRKPQRRDLLCVRLPVLRAVDVPMRLAQVGDEVGLLPLQLLGLHLLTVCDPQQRPSVFEVRFGESELRAAQYQGPSQPGVAHGELEGDLPPVTVA